MPTTPTCPAKQAGISISRCVAPVSILVAMLITLGAAEQLSAAGIPSHAAILHVSQPQDFCGRLTARMAAAGLAAGYSPVEVELLAHGGTTRLTDGLHAGGTAPFLDLSVLAKLENVHGRGSSNSFLSIADLLGAALALPEGASVVHDVDDLRFIPFAQRGLDLIVVTGDTKALTRDRARKVARAAQAAAVKVHVVWLGSGGPDAAQPLAWVAAMTGGRLVPLAPGTCARVAPRV